MSAQDIPPTPVQDSDPPFFEDPNPPTPPDAENAIPGSFWRYIGVLILGIVVGWFVFGWYLFPLKTTDVDPTQLRPDIADEYLIMAAESYAGTHDLRRAAKRLRYWEPEELAQRIHTLAISLEKIEPERASYLNILAQDLHLTPPTPGAAPSQPTGLSIETTIVILGLVLLLTILVLAIILAQRKGIVGKRRATYAPEPATPPPPAPASTTDELDAILQDAPIPSAPSQTQAEEEIPPWDVEPAQAPSSFAERFEISPLPDRESVWKSEHANGKIPDFGKPFNAPAPDELLDETPEDYEHPIEVPEEFTTVPSPPPTDMKEEVNTADEAPLEAEEEESSDAAEAATSETRDGGRSQVLQFDGSSDYNVIVPIEIDNDFGQFVLGVAITAPQNSRQVMALEALLYDRNDIRTVSILLAPPPLANDPDLLAQYWEADKEVAPLQPGESFHLETAYLAVDATVRQVTFGPRTNEGIPIIESAEIEFSARRSGEGI